MSQIEITPALLNDLEHKARGTCDPRWVLVNGNEVKPDHYRWSIAVFPDSDDAKFVAAASPAVVLALVKEIERLRNRLHAHECLFCGYPPKFCMCDELPEVINADQA